MYEQGVCTRQRKGPLAGEPRGEALLSMGVASMPKKSVITSVNDETTREWMMRRDIKPHANHKQYIHVLRDLTPEQRLTKAFELSEFTKQLFIHGLRQRFSTLSNQEFTQLVLQRLAKCHNRNY